jgi:hypothetical protein
MPKTTPPDPPPSQPSAPKKAGGNVKHDKRGNAVWDWNDAGDTTVALFLNNASDGLSLEATNASLIRPNTQSSAVPPPRSFNPYDNSSVPARTGSKLPPSPQRSAPAPKKGR